MVLQKRTTPGNVGYSKNCECFAILTAKLSNLEYDDVQSMQPVFQEDLQLDVVDILRDLISGTISIDPPRTTCIVYSCILKGCEYTDYQAECLHWE
jgi:hypothetical protein